MTDSTMVERVARAIMLKRAEDDPCGLYHQDRGACFCDDDRFVGDSGYRTACQCKSLARAAIEAMMEPTPEARIAGAHAADIRPSDAAKVFQAMLRSSLKGEGE